MTASIAEQFKLILGEHSFWNLSFLGNEVRDYLIFFILFGIFFLMLGIFKKIILRKIKDFLEKTENKTDDIFISIIDAVNPLFYWYIAFFLSVNILNLHSFIKKGIGWILVIWVSYQAVLMLHIFIDHILDRFSAKEENNERKASMSSMGKFIKIVIWLLAGLFVLSNLGVNVTSVMAGLGIGGIAIAFALQNILGDLFSSFAIYFDKPFVVGDFIIVDKYSGTVEKIGIKSTRIRALQGEEIVISNRELTNSRIQNFKKLQKRRVVFNIGVIYDTSLEKVKMIPEVINKIIEKNNLSEVERVHFSKFADSSLNFEITYYVLSGDYNDYMDTHQKILFRIKEEFDRENIEMAFPTQTIILEKEK